MSGRFLAHLTSKASRSGSGALAVLSIATSALAAPMEKVGRPEAARSTVASPRMATAIPEGSIRALVPKLSRAELEKRLAQRERPVVGQRTIAPSTGPNNVVVDNENLNGWEIVNYDQPTDTDVGTASTTSGTDGDFVTGPAPTPAGVGSFFQKVGTNGGDGQRVRTDAYNGTLLIDLDVLRYWAYVDQDGVGGQASYLGLFVDTTNDGNFDDILIFEPVYQTGTYIGEPVPAQGPLALDTWQQWDAAIGGWWSVNDGMDGPPLYTLASYSTLHPGAKVASDVKALRVLAGFGNSWPNFRGNFDLVQVNKDIYDFEQFDYPVTNLDTGNGYLTIQAAISDAATVNGHRIQVDPGTYNENVTLDKDLTLIGAQAGNTACGRVIGAPNPATESIITGAGALLTLVTGSAGSTIDGFSFSGGTIGITSSSGPIHDVTIQNNHFSGFTTAATFLNDTGRDVTIQANDANGSSKTGTGGTHHFDTDAFEGLWVKDNCVHDGLGTGMFVDGIENVKPSINRRPAISGNRFENQVNNAGLNLGSRAFTTGDIANNLIKGHTFDGIQGGIRNSQITGNRFEGNGRWGLALTSFGNTTAPRGAFNDTITGNTFTDNDSAGYFISAAMFAGHAASNRANYNDIVGNGNGVGYGAIYRGSETIEVSCNWWGDINGPDYPPANPNPPGDGLFAPSANYFPWLDGSITGTPSCNQFPPVNTTTTLSSDINPSSCGQKVMLTATVSPNTTTGTVEFFDGGVSIGTSPVGGGTATLSWTFTSGGHHTLTASYSGDGDHNPSTSGVYVQNVHCAPSGTTTVVTTPCNTQGWVPNNVLGSGTVAITGTYPHVTGSLEFNTTGTSDKADFARLNGDANLLSTLSALAIDLYRNSSSTGGAHLVPAVRLFVDNGQATNRYSYLIWEAAYNGYNAGFPADAWTGVDLFKGNFWQRAFKPAGTTIDLYDRTLSDWLQPGTVTDGSDVSNEVGPNARVLAYEIGVGSGWSDTFAGAADNFRIGFAGVDSVFDFETEQATSLTLSAPPSSICGDKVTLSADLTPAGIAGSIDFFDGATPLGSVPMDANGHAELSVNGLTVGGHSFTASYAGAPCIADATSNKVAHQVNAIATTTSLVTAPPKSFWGGKVDLNATVTPNSASGTVDFLEVTADKSGLFPTDPTPANPHFFDLRPVTIGVKFFSDVPGVVNAIRFYKDANNSGPHTVELWSGTGQLLASAPSAGESASGWQTAPLPAPVAIQASTIYIAAYHTESGYPQDQFYFTSQLDSPPLHAPAESPGNPNGVYVYAPAGTFPVNGINASNYYVDLAFAPTTPLGSGIVSGGQATLSISTLEVGVHTLVAAYGGDVCHAASASSKTTHEVNQATPTVLLESDNNPSERNEKITFTVTVPVDATGSVELFIEGNSYGTEPVSSGSATFSVSSLTAGTYSVTATYSGDSHYETANSNKVNQVVELIPTTTTLVSSPNPSTCGQKVTFTATVDPAGGTGSVEFFDDGTSLGVVTTPSGPGIYELSISTLAAGVTHPITAVYSGDGKYATSTSNVVPQQVDKLPTSVVLQTDNPDVKEATKVTLTATVSPVGPTGTVNFYDETAAQSIGTAPVDGSGVATLSIATLSPGSHMIHAEYLGDGCYLGSTSNSIKQNIQVDDPPSVTVVTPNGGENWLVGSTQKVSWTATDDNSIAYVDLYVSRDNGGTYEKIASMTANAGTYTWNVTGPGTNVGPVPVFSALWKVVATDNTMQPGEDVSDLPFSIYDQVTPTLLATFYAAPISAGIELHWSFAPSADLRDVTLERADRVDGMWTRIEAEMRREGEETVAIDRTARPGTTYHYRLVASDASGRSLVFGPLTGTAGAAIRVLALAPARPNPSRGPVTVEFDVPRESRVQLDVVDVLGRQVARLADGTHRAGRYQLTWDGTGDRGRAPVGVYFLRLSSEGRTLIQRVALAR